MLNLKKDEKHVPSLLLFLIRMVHVDMSFFYYLIFISNVKVSLPKKKFSD